MAAIALAPIRYQAPPRCRYQEQDTRQTLAEGLAEYYAMNKGIVSRPDDLPPESAALFKSHDMCHVLFGLDTTFVDEAMADTRTMLSCDVGVRRYVAYLASDAQAKAILKQAGVFAFVWGTVLALPRLARAVRESVRMTKRWPWQPPEEYLRRPLRDLRAEYGVRVV